MKNILCVAFAFSIPLSLVDIITGTYDGDKIVNNTKYVPTTHCRHVTYLEAIPSEINNKVN